MAGRMSDEKQKQADELFVAAMEAARIELRRSLRDPLAWVEQVVEMCFGAAKLLCLILACGLAVRYFTGLDGYASIEPAVIVALVVFALNPQRLIWKNHFRLKADAAFERALRAAR